MPAMLAFLLSAATIGGIVKFVLSTVGVGLVTYVGMDAILGLATAEIISRMNAGDAEIAGILGLSGVDIALNVIFSAFSIRLALTAVKSFRAV